MSRENNKTFFYAFLWHSVHTVSIRYSFLFDTFPLDPLPFDSVLFDTLPSVAFPLDTLSLDSVPFESPECPNEIAS